MSDDNVLRMGNGHAVQFFPDELIELNIETGHDAHSELHDRLSEQPSNDITVRLACIAAYCDVLLDGFYTTEDQLRLCSILTRKLYEKRTSLILPH